jgi:mevalonate kinase
VERIIAIVAKQKMHAKLTGAGGGGFAYALITPWHTEAQIKAAKVELESSGFLCWEAQLAGEGVKFNQSFL